MKSAWKIGIILALAAAVAATFALRADKRSRAAAPGATAPRPATQAPGPVAAAVPAPAGAAAATATRQSSLPRLLEVGSSRCMACQEMAKVLDALRASQGERLQVDFVDVNEDLGAMDRYRIQLIPTQILYDAAGTEIFRHIGYFSHDDILAKFRELGVKI